MPAHRYWDVSVDQTEDGDVAIVPLSIAEIALRGSVGGSDLTGSGTAIQSSGTGSNAFDNNTSSDYTCGAGQSLPQNVGYDFGSGNDVDVAEVYITASNSTPNTAPINFYIRHSDDGVAWTNAIQYTGEPNWSAGESRAFAVSVSAKPSGALTIQAINTPVKPSGALVVQAINQPRQSGALTIQAINQPQQPTAGRRWQLVVMLDGVDVSSRVYGLTEIDASKGKARIAEFSLRPFSGAIDAQEWVKKPVTIDRVTFDVGS